MGFNLEHKERKTITEVHVALAKLLVANVLTVSEEKLNSEDRTISLWVNCNDVFVNGSDALPVSLADVFSLYGEHVRDEKWGALKWCAKQLNLKPMKPVIKAMKKDGAWDKEMKGLKKH